MVRESSGQDRRSIYSEIFGLERRPNTLDPRYHGEVGLEYSSPTFQELPDKIEDIERLDEIVFEEVSNDILSATEKNDNAKNKDGYILSHRTHMRKVSDTQSIVSGENTPRGSPRKLQTHNSSPSVPERSLHRPPPIPTSQSSTDTDSGPSSSGSSQSTIRDPPVRSKSDFIPRRTPSLPQLSIPGLRKQASFSTSNDHTPTQSKRSPLQGFGLFSRHSVKESHDQHSTVHPQYQHHQPYHHQPYHSPLTPDQPSGPGLGSRSMSLNSSALKNLASSMQSKSSSSRKAAQKSDVSNNPFIESHSSYSLSHQASSYDSNTNNNNTNNNHAFNNKHINSSMGLGIRTRNSSTSLTSKRFTSGSVSTILYDRRSSASLSSSKPIPSASIKKPQVYPALLSRVATKFKSSIQVGDHKKDGLIYRDAFTGQQAVDVICTIIRTSDRNLALLLGRSLDSQKLFHDVVYEHRLRDSPHEVYEFTDSSRVIGTGTTGVIPLSSRDPLMLLPSSSQVNNVPYSASTIVTSGSASSFGSEKTSSHQSKVHQDPASMHNVNGVFTLLAECYSPTCTRDQLCYSISCPRRLEQQARLNLKPNGGLKRNISMALDDDEEEKPSWTSSVPEEIWKNLPKKEIKRQETIYEVFITEKNFVKSLEVTRDTFMRTLAETNIIPSDIRKNFIKHVFAHINDIYSVNRRFLEALSDRQKSSPVVKGIGDIILRFIPFFEPFVSYVASRPYAKYLIETQRSVNPYFARFDDDMMSSSLRHGIDSFLSQGVSRPGRYMLLVKEIMKSSDPEKDKRDYDNLSRALDALRAFMKRIDRASGAAQDRHDVKLLKQKILFKNEYVNLGLNDEKRKIKHEGVLSRKELTKSDNSVVGDIQFYVLDNMLLFLKAKSVNKWHQHKVFQRPIPLPLLFACPAEDMPPLKKFIGNKPDCYGTVLQPEYSTTNPKNAITFLYYGAKQKYQVTLYAAQFAALQTLLEKIKQEQARIISETEVFNVTKISDKFFDYTNKINSVASCDGGRKLLIATNSGLYMSNIKRQQNKETGKRSTYFSPPVQLVQRSNINQVAVLEEFQSILLLVDKKLYKCPLALLQVEGNGNSFFKKHSKELVNHVNFFAEGDCNGKRLVVTAHSSSHSIKYFEHEHPLLSETGGGSSKSSKRKITEVVFDSEPVSISFLKANLCIGCKKGFQIVSVSQNAHESLLDPADTSLEFALRDTLKPMAIYRVGDMFLLCYAEFAFFVNTQGWRKKDSHIIHWEGEPQKFAIWYPYILAFDSNFIEIRKIDTGELVTCVLAEKIRLLQTSSQEILYVYEDSRGYDTVASLDFWG